MGLKEQQAALAKLYTSQSYREHLANSGSTLDGSLELNQAEQAKLNSILEDEVTSFATSLIRKRLGQVKNMLPGTCALLGEKLWDLFQCFAANQATNGVKRHLIDARNFTHYLAQKNANEFFNVKAHQAVLKYEQTWLNSELSIRCIKVSSFRHDISNYAQRLAKREAVATYSGKPRVCIWLRISGRQQVLYWELFPRFWTK